jgi:hypothetical protein
LVVLTVRDDATTMEQETTSRVRLTPHRQNVAAEVRFHFKSPSAASEFVAAMSAGLSFFDHGRPHARIGATGADLVVQQSVDWAQGAKVLPKSGRFATFVTKSVARTNHSVVDTWGTRRCAQLLRDVLSGLWKELLEITLDPETAPRDGNWDPLFEALQGRVVAQEYIDARQYRPVALQFDSVYDLTGELLEHFFSAIEGNHMRVIEVVIKGHCPYFGVSGLETLCGLVTRESSSVTQCTVDASVLANDDFASNETARRYVVQLLSAIRKSLAKTSMSPTKHLR